MSAVASPALSIDAFEAATVSADAFDYEAHIYMAWLYLGEYPPHEAVGRFTSALRRFTAKLGVPDKYHETISWFFMLLVEERRSMQQGSDWFAFHRSHADLFARGDDSILYRYYSRELLMSDHARQTFVLPDSLPA